MNHHQRAKQAHRNRQQFYAAFDKQFEADRAATVEAIKERRRAIASKRESLGIDTKGLGRLFKTRQFKAHAAEERRIRGTKIDEVRTNFRVMARSVPEAARKYIDTILEKYA